MQCNTLSLSPLLLVFNYMLLFVRFSSFFLILLFLLVVVMFSFFFFSSRRRHTRLQGDWSSDVCSSDLTSRIPSGGTQPVSLTVHGNLLYVLNGGVSGNIAGFALDANGGAAAIPGSSRALSGTAVGPAQIAFSSDGRSLVMTEKNTNAIDVYAVGPDGVATGPVTYASAGGTPFGFAFDLRDELLVSEAAGTASSYLLGSGGSLTVVSGAVSTQQGAPCWLVVTQNGRFAYTANAHSGTISGFAVGTDGALSLLDAGGATAVVGPGNIDLAVSANSRYLYQLRSSGPITALRVENDGHLTTLGMVGAMPGSVAGLVAQ